MAKILGGKRYFFDVPKIAPLVLGFFLALFRTFFAPWGGVVGHLSRWLVGELGTAPLGFPSPVSAPGAEGRQNFLTG